MEARVLLVHGDVHAPRWRREVVDRLLAADLDPGRRGAVELAIHEALCNALEHGHGGDPTIGIELRFAARRQGLEVAVVDAALGGHWSPPRGAAIDQPRGHGLRLIRAGCDALRIEVVPGATRVVMTFTLGRHPSHGVGANGLER